MASLRDYFETDFKYTLSARQVRHFKKSSEVVVEVIARVHLDFDSRSKYISYYLLGLPDVTSVFKLYKQLIENPALALSICDTTCVEHRYVGEDPFMGSSTDLVFSGRIFLYSQVGLPATDLEGLHKRAKELGIALIFRGPKYVEERSAMEKPLVFICHDGNDKDDVAQPIAIELSKMMCPVWFDQFSLKVGDSLRISIEKGLKECKKCIVILSPHFLSNNGWTKAEFDSIYTREILEKGNVILPVWHNVTAKEVYDYCPRLADKFAVSSTLDKKEVARQLYKAIMT